MAQLNPAFLALIAKEPAMPATHRSMSARPVSLTIQELPHGGYVVIDHAPFRRGLVDGNTAAFTRLTDAVAWMEEQMRLPAADHTAS